MRTYSVRLLSDTVGVRSAFCHSQCPASGTSPEITESPRVSPYEIVDALSVA